MTRLSRVRAAQAAMEEMEGRVVTKAMGETAVKEVRAREQYQDS